MRYRVEVLFVANGTASTHTYTCDHASRNIVNGSATIIFRNGRDLQGRKVVSAQYGVAASVIVYEEDDVLPEHLRQPSLGDLLAQDTP